MKSSRASRTGIKYLSSWIGVVFISAFLTDHSFVAQSMTETTSASLFEVIESTPHFALLTFLIEKAQLKEDLQTVSSANPSTTTIFGPVDDAFQNVNEELLTYLITDYQWRLHLMNLLGFHMVGRALDSNEIVPGFSTENLVDEQIIVAASPEGDALLNSAAKIVESTSAANGVLHTIDSLLEPMWFSRNIRQSLEGESERFSTLISLGDRVDSFVNMVSSSEPYTLFAPTNDAFKNAGMDVVNNLDTEYIQEVLGYHIVPGIFTSSDLMEMTELDTSSGDKLTVAMNQRSFTINGQLILQTNMLANNGIIHVLDGLLMSDVLGDRDDLEDCSYMQVVEENLGISFGVQCTCNVVFGGAVELVCRESDTSETCSPKYGQCERNLDCCSSPRRRCVAGQCRDSGGGLRVRIGEGHGGAAARARERDRGDNDGETSSP